MEINDETFAPPIEKMNGPRYDRNRKYYLKNTYSSLRSTLLHNVKSRGRILSLETTKKYKILPEELIKAWRMYKENVGSDVSSLQEMKFKVLISNML